MITVAVRAAHIAAIAGLCSACATVTSGRLAAVTVVPIKNGVPYSNVQCTAINGRGTWTATALVPTLVKKASDDLAIKCEDKETHATAEATAPTKTRAAYVLMDFLFIDACIVSCFVDFATGSIYSYPSTVQVLLPNPGGVVTAQDQLHIDQWNATQKIREQAVVWIHEKKAGVGMLPGEVKQAWGDPTRTRTRLASGGPVEQWMYRHGSHTPQFVYFENGIVTEVSDSDH